MNITLEISPELRDKLAEHGLEMKPPKGGYRAIDLDDEEDDDF